MFEKFIFVNHSIGGRVKTTEKNNKGLTMKHFIFALKRFVEQYELRFTRDMVYQLLSENYFRAMVRDTEGAFHDIELILIKQ